MVLVEGIQYSGGQCPVVLCQELNSFGLYYAAQLAIVIVNIVGAEPAAVAASGSGICFCGQLNLFQYYLPFFIPEFNNLFMVFVLGNGFKQLPGGVNTRAGIVGKTSRGCSRSDVPHTNPVCRGIKVMF